MVVSWNTTQPVAQSVLALQLCWSALAQTVTGWPRRRASARATLSAVTRALLAAARRLARSRSANDGVAKASRIAATAKVTSSSTSVKPRDWARILPLPFSLSPTSIPMLRRRRRHPLTATANTADTRHKVADETVKRTDRRHFYHKFRSRSQICMPPVGRHHPGQRPRWRVSAGPRPRTLPTLLSGGFEWNFASCMSYRAPPSWPAQSLLPPLHLPWPRPIRCASVSWLHRAPPATSLARSRSP